MTDKSLNPIDTINNLIQKADTYELSIITCFCASIDPKKSYFYGSAVPGYDRQIEKVVDQVVEKSQKAGDID